jgi:hypothetical protein
MSGPGWTPRKIAWLALAIAIIGAAVFIQFKVFSAS